MKTHNYCIAIHGGAGTLLREKMDARLRKKYENALSAALDVGYAMLEGGGSALDAVVASVSALEDCPLFNAGRGSVFNARGEHEMDAAIMEGSSRRVGAVALVRRIRNPIHLARAVMEHTDHVLLAGKGAERFARKMKIERKPKAYFFEALRYKQFLEAKRENKVRLDHDGGTFGTVGAVALDASGKLAAATSTGGMTNKRWGRIGDSPIPGAGTWADDRCAVSCTGTGEYFIRVHAAAQLSCLMRYGRQSLDAAARKVIFESLQDIGGEGGLIAVDHRGHISMPFNTEGMYRASRCRGEAAWIGIFGGENGDALPNDQRI
ncbi:MAG: isoaspartyl peptidase/L-asparaginase [Saprospiraceae bacterium]|jgi:beta-aspartyl-peptidase (threonine type)|nr:isoaspartyl peptidase/L-asparaginase [Saprospiraceae bacterium]MBP9208739.1 isoaspartyl peptidase/L-asparaginase [Saprospiraceae bacterium]MBV6472299.1 Isoaspartyl peptidase [Saprospiraceae bacterium]